MKTHFGSETSKLAMSTNTRQENRLMTHENAASKIVQARQIQDTKLSKTQTIRKDSHTDR